MTLTVKSCCWWARFLFIRWRWAWVTLSFRALKQKCCEKNKRHNQSQISSACKNNSSESGDKLSHSSSQLLSCFWECFSALSFNWDPDTSRRHSRHLIKSCQTSLLSTDNTQEWTYLHLWPGQIPVTQMRTLHSAVKTVNFASQKGDRPLAYGILWGFFGGWLFLPCGVNIIYLHNYKCSFARAKQKEEKESLVGKGVWVGPRHADLALAPSIMPHMWPKQRPFPTQSRILLLWSLELHRILKCQGRES